MKVFGSITRVLTNEGIFNGISRSFHLAFDQHLNIQSEAGSWLIDASRDEASKSRKNIESCAHELKPDTNYLLDESFPNQGTNTLRKRFRDHYMVHKHFDTPQEF